MLKTTIMMCAHTFTSLSLNKFESQAGERQFTRRNTGVGLQMWSHRAGERGICPSIDRAAEEEGVSLRNSGEKHIRHSRWALFFSAAEKGVAGGG